jgi:hypothetical protein
MQNKGKWDGQGYQGLELGEEAALGVGVHGTNIGEGEGVQPVLIVVRVGGGGGQQTLEDSLENGSGPQLDIVAAIYEIGGAIEHANVFRCISDCRPHQSGWQYGVGVVEALAKASRLDVVHEVQAPGTRRDESSDGLADAGRTVQDVECPATLVMTEHLEAAGGMMRAEEVEEKRKERRKRRTKKEEREERRRRRRRRKKGRRRRRSRRKGRRTAHENVTSSCCSNIGIMCARRPRTISTLLTAAV